MRLQLLAAVSALLVASTALADECEGLKWNLAREYALYAGTATRVPAASDPMQAAAVSVDTLYEVTLDPQTGVNYPLPPGKKLPSDGAFGGVLSFTVPTSGDYRIGLDTSSWIDVIAAGSMITSKDFGSAHGCARPPHKLVVFELKAGTRYQLQLSGQKQPAVHVTIVKSEPPPQP